MSKNIIKGAEKCSQDCELDGHIFSNARINMDIKCRLEQMIDNCISMEISERCETVDSLLPVIYTLECLGVITNDEAMNYAKRLCSGGSQKMKQKHMEMLREIQAICEGAVKGGCSESCPFRYDDGCLFVLYPKYWKWDKFKIDERYNMEQLETIIDYYGRGNQKSKAIEEMAELIKAICKNDIENIKEEMADVYVMLSQLQIIYGFSNEEIERIKKEKIKRTIETMAGCNEI